MGKTIVLYRSEYGYTKTYAEMIAKELGCDIREASGLSAGSLMEYDTVIFGGGLYASGINGIDFIKQNFAALQKKNLVVWATGLCPGRPSELQQVWKYNFTDDMLEKIHTFYLRGGFDYQKLSRAHKIMMNALKLKIKMTRDRSEDEEGLLKAYEVPENHCDRRNIAELTAYVKSLQENLFTAFQEPCR